MKGPYFIFRAMIFQIKMSVSYSVAIDGPDVLLHGCPLSHRHRNSHEAVESVHHEMLFTN